MSARLPPIGLVVVLTTATLAIAFAGAGASEAPQRYIVGFEPGTSPGTLAAVKEEGGTWIRDSDSFGLALVEMTPSSAIALSAHPAVAFVDAEGTAYAAGAEWLGGEWLGGEWNGGEWNGGEWNGGEWNGGEWNGGEWNWEVGADPAIADQGALQRIRAPGAWLTTMGTRSAQLCTVDSGLDATHPDLVGNLWTDPATGAHGWNAIDGSTNIHDGAGHGTHVAGVAAAHVGNGIGVAGVGNVQIMAVKALTDEGTGLEGDIALGIAWCVEHGADVILLALSTDNLGRGLGQALEMAVGHDALIVAAAGNSGPCRSCISLPALSPFTVSVGATGVTDAVASFSSTGPRLDLVAPGVDVLGPFTGGTYRLGSGTSQAAALVAGAAALLRDAAPDATAAEVRSIMLATARDLGPAGPDMQYGHGILDVEAAMAAAVGGQDS